MLNTEDLVREKWIGLGEAMENEDKRERTRDLNRIIEDI